MIKIYVDFNLAEEEEAEALEAKYTQLIANCEASIYELRADPELDTEYLFKDISPQHNPEEWKAAALKEGELFGAWEAAGSAEWKAERNRLLRLERERGQERSELYHRAERRYFSELGGDLLLILADGKRQINIYIEKRYAHYKENLPTLVSFSAIDVVALGGNKWKLDAGETRNILKNYLCLHIDALKESAELTDQLHAYLEEVLKTSPYVAEEGTPGKGKEVTIRRRNVTGEFIPQVGEIPVSVDPLQELPEFNGFVRMLQGTGTHQLAQMSNRHTVPQVDPITGTATVSYNNFTAYLDNYNSLPGLLKLNALIFLDFCALYLSQLNNYGDGINLKTTVTVPLDKYMVRCDIPFTKASKDKARREVKEALETLYSISIEFDETKTVNKKKKPEHYHMRILQERSDIKNGIIYAKFTDSFVGYLNACGLMEYPTALLKVDRRNPTVYHIGRKLCYHNSLDNNRNKGTSNNISVKSLLVCCPDIPSYEEVSETDRAYDRRIIKPLEEALYALTYKYNIISSWEYCNGKKIPLTNEQLNNLCYETFIKLQIKFDITNAPASKDRLAGKEKEAKKRNARKQAAVKKALKKKEETIGSQSEG